MRIPIRVQFNYNIYINKFKYLFESYINYFHPNSITKEDMNFVLGVRNNKKVENYVYPISNPQKVFY